MPTPNTIGPLGAGIHPSSPLPSTITPYKRRPLSRASLANIRDHLCSSLSRANDLDLRAIRLGDSTNRPEDTTPNDCDLVGIRDSLVKEYNRLARKHGIRPLQPTLPQSDPSAEVNTIRKSWFSRTLFGQSWPNRKPSSQEYKTRHEKRSISDLALHLKGLRKDVLKGQDLAGLVRLCGRSILHLPEEYAPGVLSLPTCLRAPAQYLAGHATEHGLFRITGSLKTVNLLYDYYAAEDKAEVAETTRHPNLPTHINFEVHDVATLFKRILSGLPGGILGSLSLFDALVAIHSQLHEGPDSNQSTQCKIRARLIALAIGAIESQFRRELVCAVFGLVALLGKAAEATRQERGQKNIRKHHDEMMGYEALGIVFGPLLVGDLLSAHIMRLADPSAGLVLYPATPPRSRKERMKKIRQDRATGLTVDKIHVANNIAEMLISNWREAVKHMKSLHILKADGERERSWATPTRPLRPSSSMDFELRKRPSWEVQPTAIRLSDTRASPIPPSPTPPYSRCSCITPTGSRTTVARPSSTQRFGIKCSFSTLSPTAEEPDDADSGTKSRIPRAFKLGKQNRWSTVSLGSVQERSTHPALRDSPSNPKVPKLEHEPKSSPRIHEYQKMSPDGLNDRTGLEVQGVPTFGSDVVTPVGNAMAKIDEPSTGHTSTASPFDSTGDSRQESAKSMSALGTKGSVPRKITGLTRGPGSVKKLAAMFEKVSKPAGEDTSSLRQVRSQGDMSSYTEDFSTPSQPIVATPTLGTPMSPSICMARGEYKMPNIGGIVPCQTGPPIARHIRLPRPQSMPHSAMMMPLGSLEMPPGSPCSNATLHAQVRILQRELDAKTDEVLQLRRQLEAAEGSEVGFLAEKLREAERSAGMWKARADAADRQVFAFQRFFARLREVSLVPSGQRGGGGECGHDGGLNEGVLKEECPIMSVGDANANDSRVVSLESLVGDDDNNGNNDMLSLGRIRGVLREVDTNLRVEESGAICISTDEAGSIIPSSNSGLGSGEWGGFTDSEYSLDTVVISRGFSSSALGQWLRGDEELMPVGEVVGGTR